MAWTTRKGVDPASAKKSVSNLNNVTMGKWAGASYSSGKGIPKTKTNGQTPKKQTDGNINTKYSQKDATSSTGRG